MRVRSIVWLNSVLVLPAALSLYAGFANARLRSQDFQWSAANLLLQGIDPYHQFLAHDPQHLILLSQTPNYLHELYILLLPFGALSFPHAKPVWALLNCLFALLSSLLLRRIYALDRSQTLLLSLLLFSSTSFRIALGNGQQSLFELFLFCLVFAVQKPAGKGIALGLSYLKYSFSPVLVLFLAFRRQFRILAISLLPPLLGLFVMWMLVHGNILTLLLEPFAVSRSDSVKGLGDLMTILETAFNGILPASQLALLTPVAALLASVICAFVLSRHEPPSPRRDGAVLAVATLLFFPHRIYDYVFLVIPLAAALAAPFQKAKAYLLAVIVLLWLCLKFVPKTMPTAARLTEQLIVFLVLTGMLVLLNRIELPPRSEPSTL
ncbi:MAG TPA: glycosyltransferase 87 family protein [Edaphobacter sp.]